MKWIVFVLLVTFLYVAPTWEWMVAMTGIGLLIGWAGRTPRKLLLVLWLLQAPNLLGLVIIPVLVDLLTTGEVVLDSNLEYSLKLGFGWSAALFVRSASSRRCRSRRWSTACTACTSRTSSASPSATPSCSSTRA